jgi:hypothetical protein
MSQTNRILWAVAIVAVDSLIFLLPLAASVAAYVLIARPAWFKEWVLQVYGAEK